MRDCHSCCGAGLPPPRSPSWSAWTLSVAWVGRTRVRPTGQNARWRMASMVSGEPRSRTTAGVGVGAESRVYHAEYRADRTAEWDVSPAPRGMRPTDTAHGRCPVCRHRSIWLAVSITFVPCMPRSVKPPRWQRRSRITSGACPIC